MTILKQTATVLSVITIMGLALPAFAQEAQVREFDGALMHLREARTRFDANRTDVEGRREHIDGVVSVLRARIAEHKALRSADRDLVRTLDADEAKLAKIAARVRTASEPQLRTIARELKDHRASDGTRLGIVKSYAAQLTAGVRAAEKRSARIAELLNSLESEGKDVASLEGTLTEVNRKISAAQGSIADVEAIVRAGGRIDMDEVKSLLKNAASNLREAYQSMTTIVSRAQEL